MKINDLTPKELYIVFDYYITKHYVDSNEIPKDEINLKLYHLIIVVDRIINKGLVWFRNSSWNTKVFFDSIRFFTPNLIDNFLLFVKSDKDIIEESEFEEAFFEMIDELYETFEYWLHNNANVFQEIEEEIITIFLNHIIHQTRNDN